MRRLVRRAERPEDREASAAGTKSRAHVLEEIAGVVVVAIAATLYVGYGRTPHGDCG